MAQRAIQAQSDRKVKVKRDRLLKQLKENREKHGKEYKLAMEGYKASALEKLTKAHEDAKIELGKNIETARKKLEEFTPETAHKYNDYITLVHAVNIELKVPRNYTKEYDAAIAMMEWEEELVVELTNAEFQCFVRDIWDWTEDFQVTNAMYSR